MSWKGQRKRQKFPSLSASLGPPASAANAVKLNKH